MPIEAVWMREARSAKCEDLRAPWGALVDYPEFTITTKSYHLQLFDMSTSEGDSVVCVVVVFESLIARGT